MIDKIHTHILDELRINAKADTTFILASLTMNFLTLAINSIVASNGSDLQNMLTMGVFIVLTVTVSLVAEIGLIKGRQASKKLIQGLCRMYEENNVDGYYDVSLLDHYKTRYNLFVLVVLITGIVSIAVPIINVS